MGRGKTWRTGEARHGHDYRLGYGLGRLGGELVGFELSLDGHRREHARKLPCQVDTA